MSLINKMNVGNTDYDIQDRLMPDAIGQAGQVLKVKDDGSGLEFSTIESGKNVYLHSMLFESESSAGFNYYLYFYSTFDTSVTYDNITEYSTRIPFGELCHVNNDGAWVFDGIITSIQQGSPGNLLLSAPGLSNNYMLKPKNDTVTEV